MKRFVVRAAVACAALLVGCSSPHLSIPANASGAVTVTVGTTYTFDALVQNSDATVLWALTGPGTLTNSSGLETTYVAPATYDASAHTATLVASLSDDPNQKQTVTITLVKPSASTGGIPGLSNTVNVTYDERDIPTISCVKSVDCYAVLGYIHARDRLFQMDFLRRVARGKAAELLGDGALSQDQALRTYFTSRSGQPMPELLTAHSQTDPFVAPRLAAYTSGVNAFIGKVRADPTLLPGAYGELVYKIDPTKQDDLPDWSDVDTVAISRFFQWSLSDTASNEGDYGRWAQAWGAIDPTKVALWIRSKSAVASYTLSGTGAPNAPDAGSALVAGPPVDTELLRSASPALEQASQTLGQLRELRSILGVPAGSNNWVVDKDHTDIGQAFVANDPHLNLQYPSNFHLSHLVGSEDGLNVMGSIFPGVPATLIGRGTHVGWGDTVVGYDVTDLYLETLVFQGQQPIGTSFQGGTVPFIVVQPVYKFRTSAGLATVSNPTPILVAPRHGPIISLDAKSGTAVSARWTGHETETDDLRAFFRLNNAASVDDARQALEGDPAPDGGRYTGYFTGAQNFVLADDQGRIGYVPHACVPQRPWATSKAAIYPRPVIPMDGRGNFEWATGPDGGLLCVPDDQLPRAIGSSKGYLSTANADPLGTTADDDPYANNPGNVPYLSFEWTDSIAFRAARIQQVLDAKTDGGKVTLADMQALQADHVVSVASAFLPAIAAADAGSGGPADSARTILLGWASADAGIPFDCPTGLAPGALDPVAAVNDPNPLSSGNSKACLLFHTFLRRILETTFVDEEAVARVGRSGEIELRTLLLLLNGPNPGNEFCSDVDASGAKVTDRTCAAQVLAALDWAYRQLKTAYGDEANWRWGRVHTVTFSFIVPELPADRSSVPARTLCSTGRGSDRRRGRSGDERLERSLIPLRHGGQRPLAGSDGRQQGPHVHAAAGSRERERLSRWRPVHHAHPVGAEPVLQLPVPALGRDLGPQRVLLTLT